MSAVSSRPAPAPITYAFGASTGGVWLGLGTGRVALLGAGLLVCILAFTVGVPIGLALLPFLAGLVLAAARAAGRPLLDWVSPVLTHRTSIATGERSWCAPFPALRTRAARRLRLPAEYGRLRVGDCADDPSIGVLTDTTTRTVTVVFDVAGVDRFPLLEAEEKDALLGGWGTALAVLADTDEALARLQLIERASYPAVSDPSAPTAVMAGHGELDPEMAVLYRCIDSLATTRSCRLAVQWSFTRLDAKALATIAARCHAVSRSLLAARLLTRPLSTAEVVSDLSSGIRLDVDTVPVGPVSRRTAWTHVTVDDVVHRSYAVSGWPASAVTADWLDPLLLTAPPGVTRTVAIHLERVAPAAAARVARTTRAKAMLDQRDRTRLGMTSSAAIDNAETSGVAMDAELAAGYRTHRLTALVTVSGHTLGDLDDAARIVRQSAAAARLELQPLHGQHDRALAATVPLCRVRPRGQS
jgi:hypothetical protein